jgi:CRP-like cAMP-binding protein
MPRQVGKSRRAELIKGVWLFELCTPRELAAVGAITEQVEVAPGDVLTRQGEVGTELYIVLSGRATVDVDGRSVGDVGAGEFFGEMSLLDGGPRSATVTATEPMQLLVVDWRDMTGLFGTSPSVAEKMLRVVGQRLREAHARVRSYAGDGT